MLLKLSILLFKCYSSVWCDLVATFSPIKSLFKRKKFQKIVVAYLLSIKCPLVHLTLSTNADLVADDPVWHAMSLH